MKKIVLSLSFLFITVSYLNAQDIYYGPKVGINVSHLYFSGDDATTLKDMSKMKLASHFGVFAEIAFDDFFSIQPELLYSIKGARYRKSDDDKYKSSYVYKYLSLPIVGKYYVTKKISIEAGPQVAYLLGAREITVNDVVDSNLGHEAASIDISDKTQDFDFGVTLGAGYLTKTGFYLSARYNLGVLNAHKTLADEDMSLHNGAIQLSAGFSFR